MYVLVCALIIHLFIYLFSTACSQTHLSVFLFLQPVLRQEKLWKQERDSVRPRDHRQVGRAPLLLSAPQRGNESVNE